MSSNQSHKHDAEKLDDRLNGCFCFWTFPSWLTEPIEPSHGIWRQRGRSPTRALGNMFNGKRTLHTLPVYQYLPVSVQGNANPGLINPSRRSRIFSEFENALFLALPPNNGQPWSWEDEIHQNHWFYIGIHETQQEKLQKQHCFYNGIHETQLEKFQEIHRLFIGIHETQLEKL